MTTDIVLPLSEWTKIHLTTIIQAKTASTLEAALDDFLSKDAVITVNGRTVSRAEFTNQLSSETSGETQASISFAGAVEVPNPQSPALAGSVGVFFTAIIDEAIRIRVGPLQKQLTASINVVIEQDESLPPPPPTGPFHIFSDRRRVKVLNEVVLQERVPFHIGGV